MLPWYHCYGPNHCYDSIQITLTYPYISPSNDCTHCLWWQRDVREAIYNSQSNMFFLLISTCHNVSTIMDCVKSQLHRIKYQRLSLTQVHTHIHALSHTLDTHTHTDTHIHTLSHTLLHTHTHTHTYTQGGVWQRDERMWEVLRQEERGEAWETVRMSESVCVRV